MSVSVIVNFRVKANCTSDFEALLNTVKTQLPKVEGCLGLSVYQNIEESALFTLVEQWDSQQVHQKHLQSTVESGAWESLEALLTEDPCSAYMNQF